MHRYYWETAGARDETPRSGADLALPRSDLLGARRRKPRGMFICNPNNPTGTLLQVGEVEKILRAATNTAVVIDEAYAEFSGTTLVPYIGKYPHLFITRTFSKAAGLAALRLGAVIAGAKSLSYLRRAMPPFPVNLAALVAAEAAVRDSGAIRRYARGIRRIRGWFEAELRNLGVRSFPSSGNFLL